MKQGKLFYDEKNERYDFWYRDGENQLRTYGGLHCGDTFEVLIGGQWFDTRIEMYEGWYLVGLPRMNLTGLEIRIV